MRLSTIGYCFRQGLKNVFRNLKFSLASIVTIAACIFLFCMFFAMGRNLDAVVRDAETNVGITVLFDETLSEDEIVAIGNQIAVRPEIRDMHFTSAKEAWEQFRTEYFGDHPELAEGFEDDNPLAGSASYNIHLTSIELEDGFAAWLKTVPGVREVNYSSGAVNGLKNLNRVITLFSGAIILVLLLVSVFLISNTINVTAAFRKNENEIMRLIGATNGMIRAPFVIEGTMLGVFGALIPLGIMQAGYDRAVSYVTEHYGMLTGGLRFLPLSSIFPEMAAVALTLGIGIGFVVSFFTIRRHLRV